MELTTKMLRILLINDTPKKVGRLRAALIAEPTGVVVAVGAIFALRFIPARAA